MKHMTLRGLSTRLVVALLAPLAIGATPGCGPDEPAYTAPDLPKRKLAVLWNTEYGGRDQPAVLVEEIDGIELDYGDDSDEIDPADPIQLAPGWHRISATVNKRPKFTITIGASSPRAMPWDPVWRSNVECEFDFEFKARHTYRLSHSDDNDWRVTVIDETEGVAYRLFKKTQFTAGGIFTGKFKALRQTTAQAPTAKKPPAKPKRAAEPPAAAVSVSE